MKIYLSPQEHYTDSLKYEFEDNTVTATYKGVSDTFDFTNLPDGELQLFDEDTFEELIESRLDVNPIKSAKKEDGILYVELLNYIGIDATEKERFPDWIDHTEYIPPKVGETNGTNEMEE